jgi:hypothetical protein
LENLPTAEFCDCGYSFKEGKIDDSKQTGDYSRTVSDNYFTFSWVLTALGGILGLLLSGRIAFGRYSPVYRNRARTIFIVGLLWIPALIVLRVVLAFIAGANN